MKRLMVFGTVTATFMLPAARTAAAQNLDGAFMFRGEARKGQWGMLGADVGGGSVFTASATGGIEVLLKPWVGIALAYNLLHVDTGNVPTSGAGAIDLLETAVTQSGPVFTLAFHWGEK